MNDKLAARLVKQASYSVSSAGVCPNASSPMKAMSFSPRNLQQQQQNPLFFVADPALEHSTAAFIHFGQLGRVGKGAIGDNLNMVVHKVAAAQAARVSGSVGVVTVAWCCEGHCTVFAALACRGRPLVRWCGHGR